MHVMKNFGFRQLLCAFNLRGIDNKRVSQSFFYLHVHQKDIQANQRLHRLKIHANILVESFVTCLHRIKNNIKLIFSRR